MVPGPSYPAHHGRSVHGRSTSPNVCGSAAGWCHGRCASPSARVGPCTRTGHHARRPLAAFVAKVVENEKISDELGPGPLGRMAPLQRFVSAMWHDSNVASQPCCTLTMMRSLNVADMTRPLQPRTLHLANFVVTSRYTLKSALVGEVGIMIPVLLLMQHKESRNK